MDNRGELAQSLTPAGRIGTAPRWRRRARRRMATLLERSPPRGVGFAAAAILLLGSVCYGVVEGGHAQTIRTQVQDLCDTTANALGFGIAEIALTGTHDLNREEVLTTAGITGRTSLLLLDAADARARLLTNPWIADAAVLKLYPGRLRIEITERRPFALWQVDGQVSLVAADGTVLEPYLPPRFLALPLVVGEGAAGAARPFLSLVARFPAIAPLVEASVLVAQRRWTLYLKDGVEVLLPEGGTEQALATLSDLAQDRKLLSRDIVAVDLRLANRVTVRLSEAAAAARAEKIEAVQKARKVKRKGGEA